MSKLQALLEQKRISVEKRKFLRPVVSVPSDERTVRWDRNCFRIMAEIKRASLSAGQIRPETNVRTLAKQYQKAGAAAISILTEENHFHGSLDDLRRARDAVKIPILQKDFIIDPYQILEAKESGADFVLLIARLLTSSQITAFQNLCHEIRMDAIVEITCEEDLGKILCPVRFLGVNSRDLETLATDAGKFRKLRPRLPDCFLIAESGISTIDDLNEVMDLGYHAALIGEHFLRQDNPAEEVSQFVTFSERARNRSRAKICGITTGYDALLAVECGADALGFIFAESPRRILPQALDAFRSAIPRTVLCVGVFRGQTSEEIEQLMDRHDLDVAQVYGLEYREVVGHRRHREWGGIENVRDADWRVWEARMVHSVDRIDAARLAEILWDVKADEEDLAAFWKKLALNPVFALAGGLHAGNVRNAIEICRPRWVDVARGVESKPGVKNERKVRDFLRQIEINSKEA